MKVESGNFYRLIKPEFAKTIGQGEPPEGMTIGINSKTYLLKYGSIFKASDDCDKESGIGRLDMKPYPLLEVTFIEQHINQFEEINIKPKNEAKK